jgi:hypothetical protein
MIKALLGILCIFLGVFSSSALEQGRPIPPGVREADKQSNAPLDPPAVSKMQKVDPKKLKEEADELAKLSAAVPPQVAQVAQGQLPKDLSDQLKRIEKLAKHLRGEIYP